MIRTLAIGSEELQVTTGVGVGVGVGEASGGFRAPDPTSDLLARSLDDPHGASVLRELAAADPRVHDPSSLDDDDLLHALQGMAFHRGISIARRRGWVLSTFGDEPEDGAPAQGFVSKAYELLLRVVCEVTSFALPRAQIAVFDDQDRSVYAGQVGSDGEATVDVGVPGNYRAVVLPPRVPAARLILLGADGAPLPVTEIEVEDSLGDKQTLTTSDDGQVQLGDAASGIAKVKVGNEKKVRVYLHPRHGESVAVHFPKLFAPRPADPYAHEIEPEGAKDPPPPDPKPPPAPTGGSSAANTPVTPPPDPAIDALNLAAEADHAARVLKQKTPGVVFTSGRRSVKDQVHAMAVNVAAEIAKSGKSDWIQVTYVKDSSHKKLQQWIDDHPDAKTTDAIAAGLEDTVDAMTEAEKLTLSKHITGRAFDIEPGTAKEEDVQALPGLKQFLKKEGTLVRWHCQF